MNDSQRKILIAVGSLIGLMLLYPPFQVMGRGLGYSWIFSPPYDAATINAGQLLVQWVAVALIGGIAYVLSKNSRVQDNHATMENGEAKTRSSPTTDSTESGLSKTSIVRTHLSRKLTKLLIAAICVSALSSLIKGVSISDGLSFTSWIAFVLAGAAMSVVLAVIVAAIPAILFWLIKRDWMPGLMDTIWVLWALIAFGTMIGNASR